jgi:glycosyltransferase involved in cell wall biosynthesis
MRIALVSARYPPSTGGVQHHVQHLARNLVLRGHDVTVLTHEEDPAGPETEWIYGVEVRRFPAFVASEHLTYSPALGRHLASAAGLYDVVHVHGYHDTPAAVVMHNWSGPYVFTPHFHGTSAGRLRGLLHVPYRRVGRRIVGRAAAVICVTEAEREALCTRFPTAARKSVVISNGVDVNPIATTGSDLRGHSGEGDTRTVVVVGRLEAYKRVDRMIAAMEHLRDDLRLVVIGDGPERDRLERMVRRLALEDRVTFRGRVGDEELARTVASASVLVSLSEHEAQGLVLLEAASVGTPTVASDIAAHRDVAATSGSGTTLVGESDSAAQIAVVVAAAADGPRVAVRVPDWQEVTSATEVVYLEALSGPAQDPGAVDSQVASASFR